MPLIYPVAEETPDDVESTFDDFADDWSDTWVIEIDTDPEHEDGGDYVRLGPLGPQAAWDLAHAVEDKRSGWMVSIMPLFGIEAEDVDDLINQIESEPED